MATIGIATKPAERQSTLVRVLGALLLVGLATIALVVVFQFSAARPTQFRAASDNDRAVVRHLQQERAESAPAWNMIDQSVVEFLQSERSEASSNWSMIDSSVIDHLRNERDEAPGSGR